MGRFTARDGKGNAYIQVNQEWEKDIQEQYMQECVDKMAEYEDMDAMGLIGGKRYSKQKRDESIRIKCPFYVNHTSKIVYCEGTEKDNTIMIKFDSYGKRERYFMKNCEKYNNECLVAKMLQEKYKKSVQ